MNLETKLDRLAGGTTSFPVREDGLVGTLFLPTGNEIVPGVIVLGGSGGGVREYEARLLAFHGFAALALRYFGGNGLPTSLLHIPLEYVHRAMTWLQQHPRCRPGGIGVVGFSRGGELALLLGATYPEVHAVVSFVPSGIVAPGLVKRFGDHFAHARSWLPGTGRGWRSTHMASWTLNGQPLPYMQPSLRWYVQALLPLLRRPRPSQGERLAVLLRDTAAIERAAIPVERIKGPVLLFSAGRDDLWPSDPLSRLVMDRLGRHHHPYPDEHICYPDAPHVLPEAAYRDAWERAIPFLHAALSESSPSGD